MLIKTPYGEIEAVRRAESTGHYSILLIKREWKKVWDWSRWYPRRVSQMVKFWRELYCSDVGVRWYRHSDGNRCSYKMNMELEARLEHAQMHNTILPGLSEEEINISKIDRRAAVLAAKRKR